jgi:hypothetical protein
MKRHQVYRKRVKTIAMLDLGTKHEVVKLCELVHELPDPIIGRVEDVWPVLMNVNPIVTLAVAISTDVRPAVYQQNMLSFSTGLMGKNAPKKTSANNEIVVHGLY